MPGREGVFCADRLPDGARESTTRDGGGRLLIAGAVLAAVWAVAACRWFFTDRVVPWDSKNQFYAFFRFLATSLHDGTSPFWNPYHYGGHPGVADPQSLIFTPVFVLWALFDPAPSMRMFDLVVQAHLLAGGLCMAVLGRRRSWPIAACVLAGVVFMFGGPAAGRLQHTGMILSYALVPPAILLLEVALQRRSHLAALAFAVVAAALILGRNQVALLSCFLLLACGLAEIATAERPLRHLRERGAVIVVMTACTAALIAVPLLLTVQFAALSNRSAVTLEAALMGSFHPANFIAMAVADVFGAHGDYWGPNAATAAEVAYTDDSFNYMFVGSVTMTILVWFGIVGGGCRRAGVRLFTAVLALAVIFMLGRYTPMFAFAFEWVPGVDLFRRPVDAGFVAVIAIAFLSGALLADYVRSGPPRMSTSAAVVVAAGVVLAVTAAVRFSGRSGRSGEALFEVLRTMPVPLAAGLICAFAGSARTRACAAAVAAATACAELLWWNVAFRLNAEPSAVYAVLERSDGEEVRAIAILDAALAARHAQGARPRVEIVGLGGAWQNLAMVRKWEATNGYNPLRIGAYDRLVSPGEGNWTPALRQFPTSFPTYDCALARTLGLEFLVLGRPLVDSPALASRTVAEVLMAGPKVWIYRLKSAAPRVAFVAHEPDDASPVGDATARIVSYRPDRVDVDVMSSRPGILTLHSNFYPGWIAEIDGRATTIQRSGGLFQAVAVSSGAHRVVFRFAPFSAANLVAALQALGARPR